MPILFASEPQAACGRIQRPMISWEINCRSEPINQRCLKRFNWNCFHAKNAVWGKIILTIYISYGKTKQRVLGGYIPQLKIYINILYLKNHISK